MRLFKEKISSNSDKNKEKLSNILRDYKLITYRKGEAANIILGFIKNNKILSTRKLCKLFNKSFDGLKYHLYILERKQLIKRVGRTPEGILWSLR